MKSRRFLAIITAVIMLLSVGTVNTFAFETYSSNVLTPQDVSDYQDVLDRLNDEYGYSMYFSPEVFTRSSTFENPTKSSLSEFETTIRKEIEEDIAINLESQAAIAELGTVKWENAPFEGKTYTIPANVSIYNSTVMNEV